ncbi:MAG: hypothetical protein DHS20C15_32120 [Planctomycetota bacterium]|nr:MAG: hypothetical protein DHS20C15_32120 [Planctomycetota bacterium]
MLKRVSDTIREAGALGPLALFTVGMPALAIPILASTHALWFEPMRSAGVSFLPGFVVLGAVCAGLSLVPTHAVSLVAGLLFGATLGSAVALFTVMLGAALGFGVSRRLLGDRLLSMWAQRPRAAAVHRALVQRGARRTVSLTLLIRLSPVMPFAGTNLLLAAARMRWRDFLVGSSLGLAPRVLAVAILGAGLSELDFSQSLDRSWMFAGVLVTVVTLMLIGRWARRALNEELIVNAR